MISDTIICRWKDDKKCAYSLCADDSTHSHLDFMAAQMLRRGFAGTFWINPGLGEIPEDKKYMNWGFSWLSRKSDWLAIAREGFDFANHTMHHRGAKNHEEAEYEIGECSRVIWDSVPGQKLQLFLPGGGTTWDIPNEDIYKIAAKYDCVAGRGGGMCDQIWDAKDEVCDTEHHLIQAVDSALKTGSWRIGAFHGVGPRQEWIHTDDAPFIALLDYLYEKRADIWIDTNTKVHKYMIEYAHAQHPTAEVRENGIYVTLTVNHPRLDLYDYPLTLKTEVPPYWENCVVIQGDKRTSRPVRGGWVMYEAAPGKGEVRLENFLGRGRII